MGSDIESSRRHIYDASTASLCDWSNSKYHYPIMANVPNGFPLRKPATTEAKLRQMYLNANTVSGKILISSSNERARLKRMIASHREIERQRAIEVSVTSRVQSRQEEQEHQLRSPSREDGRSERNLATPPVSQLGARIPVIPPINSAKGMTVVKKVLRRSAGTSSEQQMHLQSQVDVYLPRAEQPTNDCFISSDPNTEFYHGGRAISSISGRKAKSRPRMQPISSQNETSPDNRPITATW